MMITEWTSLDSNEDPIQIVVETEKEEDETDADQAARHHAAVLAKLIEFPIHIP